MCDATDVKENGTFSVVARTMGESSVGGLLNLYR